MTQANPCPHIDTTTKTAKCRLMTALNLPWAECHPEHYAHPEKYSTCRLKQQQDQNQPLKPKTILEAHIIRRHK
jgi:hypothetical protein